MKTHILRLTLALCFLWAVNTSATVYYVDLNSATPTPPYTNWATAATNVQVAVDAATNGDLILVTNGVYQTGGRVGPFTTVTNRIVVAKAATIQSVNGPTVTVIQGFQVPGVTNGASAVRCAYLTRGAILVGFTLTNGATGSSGIGSDDPFGGGVLFDLGGGVVSNCVLVGNSAYGFGGGAYGGKLYNCTITGNYGNFGAGGAELCTLVNCAVINNSTSGIGGGTSDCSLTNCTVTGNSANSGGGVANQNFSSSTSCRNCLVYYNTASSNANYTNVFFNYSCTLPLPTNGFGNITNAPLLVDQLNGNFRLQAGSPCINAGNNAFAPPSPDLDGNPRIAGGTVDIGAYEFQSPTSLISYAWLQQFGLPTDGSADFLDSDGDGMNNWQEWLAGTNPTNTLSVLRMLTAAASTNTAGATVTWQSVAGVNYFLQAGADLSAQPPFQTIATNITGLAGTTSYTDTNATASGPLFYRVFVQ